jgi:hypothetical protein
MVVGLTVLWIEWSLTTNGYFVRIILVCLVGVSPIAFIMYPAYACRVLPAVTPHKVGDETPLTAAPLVLGGVSKDDSSTVSKGSSANLG